jgi:DNA-binding IclR family transcriptional regulator
MLACLGRDRHAAVEGFDHYGVDEPILGRYRVSYNEIKFQYLELLGHDAMDSVGILARYVTILDAVAAAPEGLSLSEIIARTELPRGTAHRLVNTLMTVGYLGQKDGRKVYMLGSGLMRLLRLGTAPASVAAVARPVLEHLVTQVGETVFLAKLVGEHVETIAAVTPEDERQSFVYPGRDMPMHAAASGKAILAHQSAALIESFLSRRHPKYTSATHVEAKSIMADLKRVRAQGYAVCDGEFEPGVLSYACPVLLEDAGVIYSIGSVALGSRLAGHPFEGVINALRGACEAFAQRLERHDAAAAGGDRIGVLRMGAAQ